MKKVVLRNVRLSFPALFETAKFKGEDTGKYEATFLVDKDHPQASELTDAIKEVGTEAFGKDYRKVVRHMPIKDGDEIDYDGYAGCWSIKASTKKQPLLLDASRVKLTEDDGTLYPGCYVNASVLVSAFENSYGKFLTVNLNGVQFAGDGDAFGGNGGAAIDDFEDLSGDAPF